MNNKLGNFFYWDEYTCLQYSTALQLGGHNKRYSDNVVNFKMIKTGMV